eukprot:gene34426-46189_t
MPNVNSLVETADMKAAQRSYEANLSAIEAAKSLTMRTYPMSIGVFDATSAYGRVLSAAKPAKIAEVDSTTETGGGFGSMVEKLVSDAASTMRTAETAGAKQVAGKGDLIDVVTAVGAAETTSP